MLFLKGFIFRRSVLKGRREDEVSSKVTFYDLLEMYLNKIAFMFAGELSNLKSSKTLGEKSFFLFLSFFFFLDQKILS